MLAAAAAAVANSARNLRRDPRPRRPRPKPPRSRAFAASAARVAATTTTRTPRTTSRAGPRAPVPRSIASRPQRPVVATPTTFGRLGRFTGGDDRVRTADRATSPDSRAAPPPSSARRARTTRSPRPPPASQKMSFGARTPTTAADRSPPLRVCASPSPTSRKPRRAPSRPGDEASPPPSTRRSLHRCATRLPFASGNGVGTPKRHWSAPSYGHRRPREASLPPREKPSDGDDAPPNWGPPVARRTFRGGGGGAESRRVLLGRRLARQNRPRSTRAQGSRLPTTATRVTSTRVAGVVRRTLFRGGCADRGARGRRAKRRPCFPR